MHTPNKYIAIPKDSPAIISSNEKCVLLFNNNAMKIGGTSKNVEISTSNYTLHINFTEDEIHLLQSYIPHVPKVTPNFKDFRHCLENMNTQLNDIKTHKRILTATEIVYDVLKIVGWISLGSITFYTLHKIGFLSFISKILPKAICFKICCNELRISNDSESKTYATPPSAPLPALPEDSNAYLLEELPVSRSKKIVRFGEPKATLRKGELLDLPKLGLRKNRELAKYNWLSLTKGVPLVRKSVTLVKGKVPPRSNDSEENPLHQDGDSRVPRHEKSKEKDKTVKHAEGMERKIVMPNCLTLRPGCSKTATGLLCSTTEHLLLPCISRSVIIDMNGLYG
ncbi:hypothetical protein WN48_08567 [Eufriesea mexicana]|uniref:Uncharacterized protein n=1 Tax=Eufriesea mexicana TaxID=516756 RepID=A0A310S7P5_9HYME|nr:hypothetical protein WN48_08567 [Eufriesea mexicana]